MEATGILEGFHFTRASGSVSVLDKVLFYNLTEGYFSELQ